jgi:hypothetical protein
MERENDMKTKTIEGIKEIAGLYKIIPLQAFRRTPGVMFEVLPPDALPRIDGIDRVIHTRDAVSPGPIGPVERPWYMHPRQEDFLLVLHGVRVTDVYTPSHGRVETFEVSPYEIRRDGEVFFPEPAMLVWPCGVFHRIRSGPEGSAAVNFAVRHEGFDLKTNFSIYELDTDTGRYRVIREGFMDQ